MDQQQSGELLSNKHVFPDAPLQMSAVFLTVVSAPLLFLAERAAGQADGDGEDGDGSRERHQQTATQQRLHRGEHIV